MLLHKEESALLKAYISEWTKYFSQCDHLPKPFQAMEMEGTSNKPKKRNQEGNRVQLVSPSDSLLYAWTMFGVRTCPFAAVDASELEQPHL